MLVALRHRLNNLPKKENSSPGTMAAVAIILHGEDEFLLIRRADDPADPWSGHLALPGGRWERTDSDLVQTAIRETAEEVGIELSRTRLIGELPHFRAGGTRNANELWVAPFVFSIDGPRPIAQPNQEVAEASWISLSALQSPARKTEVQISRFGQKKTFPAWSIGERKIWGLTYTILSELLSLSHHESL